MTRFVLATQIIQPIGGLEMGTNCTFKVEGSDWILQHIEGENIPNFVAKRVNDKNFHATMVDDDIVLPDGKVVNFRQLLIIEHDQGHDKVGDVVIQFRQNPHTGRFMVQVEQENVFETENCIKKIWRAARSSVDNIAQSVKKTVVHSGWMYSNPRRIGGKPIKTHYVITGWSPQLVESMMDVYDYVQCLDAQGLASFVKALQHMPDRPARSIFNQMRTPPLNGNNGK
jgi:hypothetical protein